MEYLVFVDFKLGYFWWVNVWCNLFVGLWIKREWKKIYKIFKLECLVYLKYKVKKVIFY